MKIYFAGTYSRSHYIYDESMKIFLAGNHKHTKYFIDVIEGSKPNILDSYFYISEKEKWFNTIKNYCADFLLDSGAYTFMQGLGGKPDWTQYAKQYGQFIKNHGITKYFELDLDSLMGIKEVEYLRGIIEDTAGVACIPVWHKSRGLDYWYKMCEQYDYVAIGGIVSGEIKKHQYGIFTKLISIADKTKTKVHGLGFTNLEGLKKYSFHSVDSTAWLYGNRGGYLYKFNGQTLVKYYQKDKRMKGKAAAIHNFTEWVKFSKFVESNY